MKDRLREAPGTMPDRDDVIDESSAQQSHRRVDDYIAWKKSIQLALSNFQQWLVRNGFEADHIETSLQMTQGTLQTDRITLAFVGEFSRGKTELINALFFAQHGQRLLPSKPGRTTMCPTELFFDLSTRESFLKLLPIETRSSEDSIQSYKKKPEAWTHFPLDFSNVEAMAEVMAQVCAVNSVTREQAQELKFDAKSLEIDINNPENVLIPKWRHALISFDHPLLRQGLRIIDTPGLNALGAEPELTIHLLQEAHAVLFILSADTGVTATDLEIWEEHIKHLSGRLNERMFAVLNKIDTLWDDPDGDETANKNLLHLQQQTAQVLGIPQDGIILLSAKAALRGKLFADDELMKNSGLKKLELMLFESILKGKELVIREQIIDQSLRLMKTAKRHFKDKLSRTESERQSLESSHGRGEIKLFQLNERVKKEQDFYRKRLHALTPLEQRLRTQVPNWLAPIQQDALQVLQDLLIPTAKHWKHKELGDALEIVFTQLNEIFSVLQNNLEQAFLLIERLHKEYGRDKERFSMLYERFELGAFRERVYFLEDSAKRFSGSRFRIWKDRLWNSLSFTETLRESIGQLGEDLRTELNTWIEQSVTPILKHAQQRKDMWDQQATKLQGLLESPADVPEEIERLKQEEQLLKLELERLENILTQIEPNEGKVSS
ncbi:MAG: dynamin family protein [Pseudomonadota bacterium]|nr:dynamin family protein [Pseudomonadota bacterium]|tara:strand:+ start:17812 stop:19806 length:1995 start_codon:yes stop_codon:yes gene_type:complete